jgi:hypothetical protein
MAAFFMHKVNPIYLFFTRKRAEIIPLAERVPVLLNDVE